MNLVDVLLISSRNHIDNDDSVEHIENVENEEENYSIVEIVYSNNTDCKSPETDEDNSIYSNSMDPQYDYLHPKHQGNDIFHARNEEKVVDNNSSSGSRCDTQRHGRDQETNTKDCSTILSECFSGEDTAEIGMMNGTTTVSNNDPVDDETRVVPSPIRYYITDSDNTDGTGSGRVLTNHQNVGGDITISNLITKRYPAVNTIGNIHTHNTPISTPSRKSNVIVSSSSSSAATTATVLPSMNMHLTKQQQRTGSSYRMDTYIRSIESTTTEMKNTSPTLSSVNTNYIANDTRTDTTNKEISTMSTSNPNIYTSVAKQENIDERKQDRDDDDDDDEEQELSWRMSPSKSMSDWTIEIRIKSTTDNCLDGIKHCNVTTYHVHKSVLAVGPRRSQYFVKLFRNTGSRIQATSDMNTGDNDTTKTTTQLDMEELIANAFPLLLDYMYRSTSQNNSDSTTPQIPITTYNATALHVLAERLEMKHLRTIVRNFWMQDLSMDNIAIYYQHASSSKLYQQNMTSTPGATKSNDERRRNSIGGGLDDPLIIRALEMYCAQHLFDTSGNCTIADILDLIDPQFVYNVIGLAHNSNEKLVQSNTNASDETDTFSLRLSLIVAVYCNIHYGKDLDASMFYLLTDERHLPVLESQAAKAFLELQEKLLGVPNTTLTSLTERCITVLAKNWNTVCIKQDQKLIKTVVLPRLESKALETFVAKAFLNVSETIGQVEAVYNEEKSKTIELDRQTVQEQSKVEVLEHQNKILKQQLNDLQQEMDGMKQQISMKYKLQQLSTTGTNIGENKVDGEENIINGMNVNDDDHDDTSTIETTTSIGNDYLPHQQRRSTYNINDSSGSSSAIDHGRLLLQRLDAPSVASSNRN